MSFGVSVGDFIALSKLIKDTVSVLRVASRKEYEGLISEFDNLCSALNHVSRVDRVTDNQNSELHALKTVASAFQKDVSEFRSTLTKFETLSIDNAIPFKARPKQLLRKVQFGLSMQDEIACMRARTAATVGLLNLHLATVSVNTLSSTFSEQQLSSRKLTEDIQNVRVQIEDLEGRFNAGLSSLKREQVSYLQTVTDTLNKYCPQVASLRQLLIGVWSTNFEILKLLRQERSTPSIDTRFTWAQAPVRFEDALGRVLPIPSEYSWDKVRAIIQDQFKLGPGATKVAAQKYCVYSLDDPSNEYLDSVPLIPGSSLVMAVLIGIYNNIEMPHCPRPDCRCPKIKKKRNGLRECSSCGLCFDFDTSGRALPLPFEAAIYDRHSDQVDDQCTGRDRISTISLDAVRASRNARKAFKHVRLVLGARMPVVKDGHYDEITPEIVRRQLSPGQPERMLHREHTPFDLDADQELIERFVTLLIDITGVSGACNEDIFNSSLQSLGCDSLFLMELVLRASKELHLESPKLLDVLMRYQASPLSATLKRLKLTELRCIE